MTYYIIDKESTCTEGHVFYCLYSNKTVDQSNYWKAARIEQVAYFEFSVLRIFFRWTSTTLQRNRNKIWWIYFTLTLMNLQNIIYLHYMESPEDIINLRCSCLQIRQTGTCFQMKKFKAYLEGGSLVFQNPFCLEKNKDLITFQVYFIFQNSTTYTYQGSCVPQATTRTYFVWQ